MIRGRSRLRGGLQVAVAILLANLATGCDSQESEPEKEQVQQIEAAREFEAFPVYWAGKNTAGRRLTSVRVFQGPSRVVFGYGVCTKDPGSGDCVPALQVGNGRPDVPLSYYRDHRKVTVGGVPACQQADGLVIPVRGGTVVTVQGGPASRRLAKSLRRINELPGEPLRPPPARSKLARLC